MSDRPPMARLAGRAAGLAGVLVPGLMLAACAAADGGGSHSSSRPTPLRLPLATSLTSAAGTSWAIVDMGGPARQGKNVWELFARPASAAAWRLATPGHIASSGGLVATVRAGTGAGLAAGFIATRDTGFAPVTSTANAGGNWSPGQPVVPGLARAPDALASDPGRDVLVLSANQQVLLLRPGTGPAWHLLTDLPWLARSAAGRACELTAITAVAFSPSGALLIAGDCRRAGVAGLFERDGRTWRLARLPLPARPASQPAAADPNAAGVSALSLVTSGDQTTAVLRVGSSAAGGLVAARRASNGRWTSSAELSIAAATVQSAAAWPAGAAAVVLSGHRAAVLAGHADRWHQLSGLPARVATLATGPGGQLEALAPQNQRLNVWSLHDGSWQLAQSAWVASAHK
jgi:hypothetical protein